MKFLIVSLLAAVAICSCSSSANTDAPVSLLGGTYVTRTKGEASIADDTIIVKPIPNQKDLYAIERRIGFQRITEKGIQPKEFKHENATAIWYSESNQLREQKRGRVYSRSDDDQQMLIGSMAYVRISN